MAIPSNPTNRTQRLIADFMASLTEEGRDSAFRRRRSEIEPYDILVAVMRRLFVAEKPRDIRDSINGVIQTIPELKRDVRYDLVDDETISNAASFEREDFTKPNELELNAVSKELLSVVQIELHARVSELSQAGIRWYHLAHLLESCAYLMTAEKNIRGILGRAMDEDFLPWVALIVAIAKNQQPALEVALTGTGAVERNAAILAAEAAHLALENQPDELVVVADLDQVPAEVVADFMAALDRYHRALGGSGLVLKDDHVGSIELVEAHSL